MKAEIRNVIEGIGKRMGSKDVGRGRRHTSGISEKDAIARRAVLGLGSLKP